MPVGTYMTGEEYSGVWLSDVPLDQSEGAKGDVLLCVRGLPEHVFAEHEWVEEEKPYREALIPAALINGHVTVFEIDPNEEG